MSIYRLTKYLDFFDIQHTNMCICTVNVQFCEFYIKLKYIIRTILICIWLFDFENSCIAAYSHSKDCIEQHQQHNKKRVTSWNRNFRVAGGILIKMLLVLHMLTQAHQIHLQAVQMCVQMSRQTIVNQFFWDINGYKEIGIWLRRDLRMW